MMVWMWICASGILFGAQLNSEIETAPKLHVIRPSTVRKNLGSRGAVMADTVGRRPDGVV